VRRGRGTCIVCFRPVLVTNVRQGAESRILSKPFAGRGQDTLATAGGTPALQTAFVGWVSTSVTTIAPAR